MLPTLKDMLPSPINMTFPKGRYCYVAILSIQRIVEDCSRRTNSVVQPCPNLCMLLLACVAASIDQGSTAAPRCVANKRALLACIRTEGFAL